MRTPRDIANPLDRITWRDGQLFASRDLRDDQITTARLRHLHVHYLHKTWGIVEGLAISNPSFTLVAVSAGYALDLEGYELLVPATVTVMVPTDIVAATTMYLVISRSTAAPICGATDLSMLCLGFKAGKDIEQGTLSWKTVTQIRLGHDVLLARVLVQNGILASALDPSVQRRAATLARPKLWSDATQKNQTGWVDGTSESPIEIRATIDTSNAGFIRVPLYFAHVSGASAGTAGFIASRSATSFDFVARPDSQTNASQAENNGWTIAWIGIDAATF